MIGQDSYKTYLPLALIRIWKQSMGGDTGGCGFVIRVHRTCKRRLSD